MSATFDSLISVIKRSGLLSTEVIAAQLQAYKESTTEHTPGGFLGFLTQKNLLTRWQANKISEGKHKGFFLGKYRLLTLLGRGGMSTVYLAEHVLMKRLCAVKVLPWKNVNDSSSLKRFHVEAQAAASLDHPNIVRAYDIDHQVDGTAQIHFLVMEYVDGQNLYELVQTSGVVPPGKVANYMWQAANGLQHAHAVGMVHRDVKPGNLILDSNGVIKVMDLGLARILHPEAEGSLTEKHDERVLGTADYLSPEQAVDSHLVDSRADLYGLGCTMFYLLNGNAPFRGGSLAQRIMAHQTKEPPRMDESAVPRSFQDIVYKLMAKRPEDRYQSARELADVLLDWMREYAPEELPDEHRSSAKLKGDLTAVQQPVPVLTQSAANLNEFLYKLSSDNLPIMDLPSGERPSGTRNDRVLSDSGAPLTTVPPESRKSGSSSVVKGRPSKRSSQSVAVLSAVGLFVILVGGVLGYQIFFSGTGRQKVNGGQGTPPVAQPSGTTQQTVAGASPARLTPLRKIEGTTIEVGPEGHFTGLSQAVACLQQIHQSSPDSQVRVIRIASGTSLNDRLVIDNSGLSSTFPKGVTISGEGPDFPMMKVSGADPLISLNAVEHLTIENLQLDCTGHTSAISLQGYLLGTTLKGLRLQGIESVGIEARGASGLTRQEVTIANCIFNAGTEQAVAIRCSSSELNDTRQMTIRECRFLGPAAAGIDFGGTAWDITIEKSLFFRQSTAIRFSGSQQDLNGLSIRSNTFCEGNSGIDFGSGPVAAASRIEFSRNLFSRMKSGDVLHGSTVELGQITRQARPSNGNQTDRPATDAGKEYDIFSGGTRSEFSFVSEAPDHPGFLKPTGDGFKSSGRNYPGAVAP